MSSQSGHQKLRIILRKLPSASLHEVREAEDPHLAGRAGGEKGQSSASTAEQFTDIRYNLF